MSIATKTTRASCPFAIDRLVLELLIEIEQMRHIGSSKRIIDGASLAKSDLAI
jgi:hypothetical protein